MPVEPQLKVNVHARKAGLKRLSARANAGPTTPGSNRGVFFSFSTYGKNVIEHLRRCRVQIERGLSEEEFDRIEATFGFTFPPDLRGILQEGLPVGMGFPEWRSGGLQQLRLWLNLPIAGLCYEVEKGAFWWKPWGPRPKDLDQAVVLARNALRSYPILVPVYSHCYIPSSPVLAGNPMFFVYQKEAFCCNCDVGEFFLRQMPFFQNQEPPFSLPDHKDGFEHDKDCRDERYSVSSSLQDCSRHFQHVDEIPYGQFVGFQQQCQKCKGDGVKLSNSEDSKWEHEGPQKHMEESWGRNLDALARSSEGILKSVGVSARSFYSCSGQASSRNSEASSSSAGDISRKSADSTYHQSFFSERPRLSKNFLNFLKMLPVDSAKAVRRIEFWTDLVYKRQSSTEAFVDILYDNHELYKPEYKTEFEQLTCSDFDSHFVPKWLDSTLEEMAKQLRSGGWKEDDISEMVDISSPKSSPTFQLFDRQSILEDLALKLDLLSAALKKAGWNVQDIAEALCLDLALFNQPRLRRKISPEVAARIGPLAAYVAQA